MLLKRGTAASNIVATVASCGDIIGSSHNRKRDAARDLQGALISCGVTVPNVACRFFRSIPQAQVFLQICTCSRRRSLHDFTRKFGATIAECGMAFPTVIHVCGQETVEIVGQRLFNSSHFIAVSGTVFCRMRASSSRGDGAAQERCDTPPSCCELRECFVADGTAHCVFTHQPVCFGTDYALNVIGQ